MTVRAGEGYLPVVQIGLQTLCLIGAGRVAAARGLFDPAPVCRTLNRFVVVVCLPALQFWLLAIKTDMRNMEHWRAVGAVMLWTLLVQIACTAWVLVFEEGRLNRICIHSLILTANNTGILAPVVLEAVVGPSAAAVGMLATIVLYFQQLPLAMVLFELDRMWGSARPRNWSGKQGDVVEGEVVPGDDTALGMYGVVQKLGEGVAGAEADEETALLIGAVRCGGGGSGDPRVRLGGASSSEGSLWAALESAPHGNGTGSQRNLPLSEDVPVASPRSVAAAAAAAMSSEPSTLPIVASPHQLPGHLSAEIRAGSTAPRSLSQRSWKLSPVTPESDPRVGVQGGQGAGRVTGRRWGPRTTSRVWTAGAAATGGDGEADVDPEASPCTVVCRMDETAHFRTTKGSIAASSSSSATPVAAADARLWSASPDPGGASPLRQRSQMLQLDLDAASPQPYSAAYPCTSCSAPGADGKPGVGAGTATMAAGAAATASAGPHDEEPSLRHAAQLVLGNALMWTTGAATAVSMLGMQEVLDPEVPSHLPELSFVEGTLSWLARCSVPVSLFSLGLFTANRPGCGVGDVRSLRTLVGYLGLKLLVLPWLMVFVNSLLGLDGRLAQALVVLTCVPVAQSVYVVTEQYGEGVEEAAAVMQAGLLLMLPHLAAVMALMRWLGLYQGAVA